jgi:hypothetical protein
MFWALWVELVRVWNGAVGGRGGGWGGGHSADGLQTPLTLLKNTAYTRGFKSHITQPVSNFVVKR